MHGEGVDFSSVESSEKGERRTFEKFLSVHKAPIIMIFIGLILVGIVLFLYKDEYFSKDTTIEISGIVSE